METVTSSELVRHFGVWRDRALARPLYVQHHGRAKLVLASVDFMEHLVSGRGSDVSARSIGALLDIVDGAVLVVDERSRVIGTTAAARRHFFRPAAIGDRLDDLLIDPVAAIIMRTIRSVIDGGETERLQLRVGARSERRLDVTVQAFGGGACVVAQDRTAADVAAAATARAVAIDQALAQLDGIAALRINLRGYIVDAAPTFEAMTGLAAGGYRSVRLPTLFDLPTRVGVGDALERVIETLEPQVVHARLISSSGAPLPVVVAFSGEMLRASDDGVVATIALRSSHTTHG